MDGMMIVPHIVMLLPATVCLTHISSASERVLHTWLKIQVAEKTQVDLQMSAILPVLELKSGTYLFCPTLGAYLRENKADCKSQNHNNAVQSLVIMSTSVWKPCSLQKQGYTNKMYSVVNCFSWRRHHFIANLGEESPFYQEFEAIQLGNN